MQNNGFIFYKAQNIRIFVIENTLKSASNHYNNLNIVYYRKIDI